MKQQKRLEKLINFIANDVINTTEAQDAVQLLSNIEDWQLHIQEAKKTQLKRQRSKVNNANRRAINKQKSANLTIDEWLETLKYFEGKCAYCEKKFSYEHLEHFIPLSNPKSPGTTVDNCVPSCSDCNQKKGTINIDKFLRQSNLDNIESIGNDMKRVYDYLQKRRHLKHQHRTYLPQTQTKHDNQRCVFNSEDLIEINKIRRDRDPECITFVNEGYIVLFRIWLPNDESGVIDMGIPTGNFFSDGYIDYFDAYIKKDQYKVYRIYPKYRPKDIPQRYYPIIENALLSTNTAGRVELDEHYLYGKGRIYKIADLKLQRHFFELEAVEIISRQEYMLAQP